MVLVVFLCGEELEVYVYCVGVCGYVDVECVDVEWIMCLGECFVVCFYGEVGEFVDWVGG